MEKCERCGKEQNQTAYCVKWKANECIRMESIIKKEVDIMKKQTKKQKSKLCDSCGQPTYLFNIWGNPRCEFCG